MPFSIIRCLRSVIALASLSAMILVFVCPAAWVLRWVGWLPSVQFVPAVLAGSLTVVAAIAVSVALCGRLYCSVVCPLGLSQDAVRLCFGWMLPRRPARPLSRFARTARLVILILFLLAGACGFAFALAPYGIFGRFLTVCCLRAGDPAVVMTLWAGGLFAFVLAMTFVRGRWWCNRVCPVGTFLGLCSRLAIFRVKVDGVRCVKCGRCARQCAQGALAVGEDGSIAIDAASCVNCFACVGICPKGALRWR